MRYIHHRTDEIITYVKTLGLHVMKCSYKGSSPPDIVAPTAIEDMLVRSHTLWGLALRYYISVSSFVDAEALPLREAIATVEATPARDKFLLVAYQDGGIISESGIILPFQEHAEQAQWWQPSLW